MAGQGEQYEFQFADARSPGHRFNVERVHGENQGRDSACDLVLQLPAGNHVNGRGHRRMQQNCGT